MLCISKNNIKSYIIKLFISLAQENKVSINDYNLLREQLSLYIMENIWDDVLELIDLYLNNSNLVDEKISYIYNDESKSSSYKIGISVVYYLIINNFDKNKNFTYKSFDIISSQEDYLYDVKYLVSTHIMPVYKYI